MLTSRHDEGQEKCGPGEIRIVRLILRRNEGRVAYNLAETCDAEDCFDDTATVQGCHAHLSRERERES